MAIGCGGSGGKQVDAGLDGGVLPDLASSGSADLATTDAAAISGPEVEPNNGGSITDRNDIALGADITGAISTPNDIDVFFVPVTPGQLVTATLTGTAGSTLQPHLTVIDAGRNGDDAGEDYVKIVKSISLTNPLAMQWVAMGEGGYLVVVRDVRNIESGGTSGSPSHTYTLRVDASTPTTTPIASGATGNGTLTNAGAVAIYEVDITTASDLVFDVKHTGGATGIDARVIVYSAMTHDWVARQDDRGANDPDPLVDAPIATTGKHWLVVENIEPTAGTFGFSYSLTLD